MFAHNSTTKTPINAQIGRLSVPRLTFHISSKVRKSNKVKVTRPLNSVTENQPYLQNGKACKSPCSGRVPYKVSKTYHNEKAIRETQTLRAGRSYAESKIFAPPQNRFPGAQDRQNLISWR